MHLVEGEEKERGWNLVRVRMERDCKKIFFFFWLGDDRVVAGDRRQRMMV